jgi:hypothetical protein
LTLTDHLLWLLPTVAGFSAAVAWLVVATHVVRLGHTLIQYAAVALGCSHALCACRAILTGIGHVIVDESGLILHFFTSLSCMIVAVAIILRYRRDRPAALRITDEAGSSGPQFASPENRTVARTR